MSRPNSARARRLMLSRNVLQVRGKKILILDRKVSGFLGLIAEVPLLKEHGVDRCSTVHVKPTLTILAYV